MESPASSRPMTAPMRSDATLLRARPGRTWRRTFCELVCPTTPNPARRPTLSCGASSGPLMPANGTRSCLKVAATVTMDQKVRLLKCAPFGDQTWRLLDIQGQDVHEGYWREVTPYLNQFSEAELTELIDRLLEVERPRAAFHAVHLDWNKIETSRLKRLLMAVAANVDQDGTIAPDAFYISCALDTLNGQTRRHSG